MPILAGLIAVSIAFYFYYKIKSFRSQKPMEKKWLAGKSSVALGSFVLIFGVNQLFLYQTALTYIIAALFIIIGLLSVIGGFKMYKHYLPYAAKEAEETAGH